jgi:N-acetylglutamate synthase/N-acetylornithine aminotransferase
MTKIGIHVFKRYVSKHTYLATDQFFNYISQDMTMSNDPEQILAALSTMNDIQEENGRCHHVQTALTYILPYVAQESYISNLRCLVRWMDLHILQTISLISKFR